jgi:hypothetical protein
MFGHGRPASVKDAGVAEHLEVMGEGVVPDAPAETQCDEGGGRDQLSVAFARLRVPGVGNHLVGGPHPLEAGLPGEQSLGTVGRHGLRSSTLVVGKRKIEEEIRALLAASQSIIWVC